MNGKAALVEVNVDEGGKVADAQGVDLVPTIFLFRGGERVSELTDEKLTVKSLKEWMGL